MMSAGLCSRALVALSLLSVYVYADIGPGGLQWQDPIDPDVVKAATFAVSEYNQLPNEVYDYKLVKILSAETQVVAGIIYVLNVEIGRTDCKRASTGEKSSCDIIRDSKLAKTLLCEFAVLEVPWENVESLLSSYCRILQ